MTSIDVVTLGTIAGGAALERFQDGLLRILENIEDPNTAATAKRKLVLTVEFHPSKKRDSADVFINVETKPAPAEKFPTRVFIGRHNGQLVAVENDPRQQRLFDEPEPLASSLPETAARFPRAIEGK